MDGRQVDQLEQSWVCVDIYTRPECTTSFDRTSKSITCPRMVMWAECSIPGLTKPRRMQQKLRTWGLADRSRLPAYPISDYGRRRRKYESDERRLALRGVFREAFDLK
jgi:hypothetical protein